MAEKGFGVKDINLIGPSGTPTIESPNNLNLSAVNVAISTNVSIGGTLSVTGNVSVGGTLTYEDVTNIDSVGLVTARTGVEIGDTSNTTYRVQRSLGASGTKCGLALNSGGSLNLFTGTGGSGTSRISITNTGNIQFGTLGSTYFLLEDYVTHAGDINTQYGFNGDDSYEVKTGGSTRLTVNNSGANVVGALTVNGSAISIDPTDSDIQVAYTVTANGSSAYRFAGNGVVSTADNPDLYLIRGKKYRFINNSGGSHPFQSRVSSGGSAYSTGVTNNGAASDNIDFAPTFDSPGQLVYQCTSHGGMVGNIYISGGQNDTRANHPAFAAKGIGGSWVTLAGSGDGTYSLGNTVHSGSNYNTDLNWNSNNASHTGVNNKGSHWNNTAARFLVPVDGMYHFDINLYAKFSGQKTLHMMAFNNSTHLSPYDSSISTVIGGSSAYIQYPRTNRSINCYLTAGTYFEWKVYAQTLIEIYPNYCWISGFLIG